jgi:TatD DNase family protein
MSKLMEELFELAQKPKVVAIGEVGLDYHVYRNSKYKIQNNGKEWETVKGLQRELLTRQVRVAGELDKPLVLHSREAGSDVLEILKPLVAESYGQARQVQDDGNFDKLRGVFHCYEGSKKYARRVLEAGFYISFTGNITYSPDRMEVAKTIPADRLLLETDSPYMTPQSEREAGLVNTPYNVRIVASYLAEARDVQINELERTTTQNAERLFGF